MALHARVTTVFVQPSNVDEAIRIYDENVKPVIMSQKGFRQLSLVFNRATGKGISTTVWESEADGQAYESSGTYREQVAKLASLFTSPPSLETFEVGVSA